MEDVEEGASRSRRTKDILKGNGAIPVHEHPKSRHKKRSVIDTNDPNTRDPKQEWVSTYG